ncbi:MAG: phage major capsid protein [Lachnospiraceae bacterium]|nr:phage major capsid protein [Lachnospiraceae bacterium]
MRLKYLKQKKQELKTRAAASQDIEELRSIQAQIQEIDEEIAFLEAEEREAQEAEAQAKEARGENVPANAEHVNAGIAHLGTFRTQEPEQKEVRASMEYRKAFMAFMQTGAPIPAELRTGDAINTTDTQAAIPMTIVNDVINTIRKRYGNLYRKVRKLNVRGGVEYPVGALQATMKWISEATVSPRQSVGSLDKVIFNYHTAEIRIAQTFLSQLLTLSTFESTLTEVIVQAYLQGMDLGIVKGTGNGQMLGILNDPRVTKTVTMTSAEFNNWKKWREKFFATLPLAYRNGEFIFPLSTVDKYLETMADSNNNPVFRQATGLEVNDGDSMNPNGRFFGREISLVEPDIIPDFDSASEGDCVGIFWQPEEYGINENFGFTVLRYFDTETNEWVDKALVVVDGKILNPTGFVKILKGAN